MRRTFFFFVNKEKESKRKTFCAKLRFAVGVVFMATDQLSRWRLILGAETEDSFSGMGASPLSQEDFLMDSALAAIYGQGEGGFGPKGGKGDRKSVV